MIVDGSLNDSDTIQSTGMSASRITTMLAVPHPTFCLVGGGHQLLRSVPGAAAPNPLMNRNAMIATQMKISTEMAEPMPEVQGGEQVVVAEDRHRAGVVATAGQDEDVVEDPERVQRAEEQRDQDRRLHERQGDAHEPLPRGRAVDLGRLLQVLGHQGQPGHEQQGHERRRLPHLGQDDDGDRLPLVGERRARR